MTHKSYSSGFGSVPNSTPDPLEKTEADWASAAQLSRIADSLDIIIRMIREDQEENKKRWAESEKD